MAEVTELAPTNGTRPLPEFVAVGQSPRFSPNELRLIKVVTGMTLQDIAQDPADMMQAAVWCRLRREGYDVSWEQAGDVQADMTPEPVDPTSGAPSRTSPPSAATGE